MASSAKSINRLIAVEGFKAHHPSDPGGLTYFGIARNYWPQYYEDGPPTLEQAYEFYRKEFWDPLRLEEVHDQKVADELLEQAVHMGKRRAVRIAQSLFNSVRPPRFRPIDVDGRVGPQTLGAINRLPWKETRRYLKALNGAQFTFALYRTDQLDSLLDIFNTTPDPEQGVFFRGWLNRMEIPC